MKLFAFLNLSNHLASLHKIQFFAKCPTQVVTAIGVASPIPHGQAITNTQINEATAILIYLSQTHASQKKSHTKADQTAIHNTKGINRFMMRSTNHCIAGLDC